LFDTAERARYASCVVWSALALATEHADWGLEPLAKIERWFETLDDPAARAPWDKIAGRV
jgi:hypothetical protein